MLYCLLITSAYTGNLKAIIKIIIDIIQTINIITTNRLSLSTSSPKGFPNQNHNSYPLLTIVVFSKKAFLTNPGLTSPIDTLQDVLASGLPWGMVVYSYR